MIGRLLRHYRVEAKIGEGGMGVVYRAIDEHLDRTVAIKVLPPDLLHDATRKLRFVHEAKTASALNHPNIVAIYDIDSDDGVDFIAMEYVPGETLLQRLRRSRLLPDEMLRYAIEIADALAAAHNAGVLHRDLKPANIVITESGPIKLLDFGLAKLIERPEDPDSVDTMTFFEPTPLQQEQVMGTAAYMSPEQAEGKKLDTRSDIFALGTVLYEMAGGRHPFKGDSQVATLSAIL